MWQFVHQQESQQHILEVENLQSMWHLKRGGIHIVDISFTQSRQLSVNETSAKHSFKLVKICDFDFELELNALEKNPTLANRFRGI